MRLLYSPRYCVDIGAHTFPTRKWALTAELARGLGPLVEPPLPSRDELLLAHAPEWVDKVLSGRMTLDDETRLELPFSPEISLAHQLQVSGTVLAARDAVDGGVGLHVGGGSHHAFRGHGEGFCVLNDLACAALALRAEGRVRRVAIVDLDVHQGNGTAAIFSGDPAVFTLSLHQQDLYPQPKQRGSLDVGLPAGTGDESYLAALAAALPRALEAGPELVLYQAGVDCAAGDALGGLCLTPEGLRRRDEAVRDACRRRGIPVAVTLGGGYSAEIERTARLHARTLAVFADTKK